MTHHGLLPEAVSRTTIAPFKSHHACVLMVLLIFILARSASFWKYLDFSKLMSHFLSCIKLLHELIAELISPPLRDVRHSLESDIIV